MPAPSAAHTPFSGCADAGACAAEALARTAAPKHITTAPPTTPIHRRHPACRSSLKNRNPHKMPSRLFEFHSGNAMLRPISRIAKIVSVFATAHRQPASSAQSTRCGARRTSARTEEVPITSAGRLHRARKTPTTIMSEIAIGEMPMVTSFVGASAAPSHAPAVNPQKIPRICRLLDRVAFCACRAESWPTVPCKILRRTA